MKRNMRCGGCAAVILMKSPPLEPEPKPLIASRMALSTVSLLPQVGQTATFCPSGSALTFTSTLQVPQSIGRVCSPDMRFFTRKGQATPTLSCVVTQVYNPPLFDPI